MNDLLGFVTTELNQRKGEWPKIATETGVPYDTISKIARGATSNPGVLTVQTLARHFRPNEAVA